MSLLAWSSAFSVDVRAIDDQHRKLVDLANQLDDAMKAGHGKAALATILVELVRYTQYHFAFEEKLMEAHAYPAAQQHVHEHQALINAVGDFKAKFDKGEAPLTAEVMNFLRDWLTGHIMGTDKALGRDLNAKGVN